MMRKLKKGFTLVELVVVIAVVAILAAVSVVSYIGITKKAKESNDKMVIDQFNTVLTNTLTLKKKGSIHELLEDLNENAGFDIRTFAPELQGTSFVYYNKDSHESFAYWDKTKQEVIYPKDLEGTKKSTDLWFFDDAVVNGDSVTFDDGASHYLKSLSEPTVVNVKNGGGVDVGKQSVTEIKIVNEGSKASGHIVARTNGGTLRIDAPLDTLDHYGDGEVLDIAAIAGASYHEYGNFPKASIAQGRIVIEESGNIPAVEITEVPTSENPVKVETDKDIVVSASPKVVEQLGDNDLENVEVKVTSAQATVVVDEKINKDNVDATGKTSDDVVSIAKVNDYSELSTALTAKKPYIMFTNNISYAKNGNGLLNVDYSVTIDGDGHQLNGYGTRNGNKTTLSLNNGGGSAMIDVKLQNLTVNNSGAAGRPLETRGNIRSFELENVTVNATGSGNNQAITIGGGQATAAKLTIKESTINASASGYPIISFNPFNADIVDSYLNGYCGVYFKNDTYGAQNCNIVATNTTFNSPNSYSYEGDNSFGVFAIQENVKNNKVTLNDCKVNVEQSGTAYQALVSFGNGTNHSGTVVTINGSESYVNGLLSMNGQIAPNSKIVLNGGRYSINPLSEDAEQGTQIVELGSGKTVSSTSEFIWIVQ